MDNATRYLALAVLIIIIGAFGTIAYYYGVVVVEEYTLPVDIEVIEDQRVEFNLDTDGLHFGSVHADSTQTRYVNITNAYEHDVRVRLRAGGALATLLSVDQPEFVLGPGQRQQVAITLITPNKPGKYTGSIQVTLTK